MACVKLLTDYLTAPYDVGGYFVYLGYHATEQITPADTGDDTCFTIDFATDNNADKDTILEGIVADVGNPYGADPGGGLGFAAGTILDFTATIDFTDKDAGFYGFMYIVGDQNKNDYDNPGTPPPYYSGHFDPDECGTVECFEIEVVASPATMTGSSVSHCVDAIPATQDLTALVTNYTAGGTWTETTVSNPVSGQTGASLNASSGLLTYPTPTAAAVGTYTFNYEFTPGDITTNFHTIDTTDCSECETQNIEVTIVITPLLEAGTGTSGAVCN